MEDTVSFHVDVDFPAQLLDFYGIRNSAYTDDDLDDFHRLLSNEHSPNLVQSFHQSGFVAVRKFYAI